MSNSSNTNIMERAAEMIDLYEGKIIAELIEQDIACNDLNALAYHVQAAEAMASQEEFENADIY